jgi:polysaccharide biosynthesis/export protein
MNLRYSILALALAAGCAHETSRPPAMARAEYQIGREDIIAVDVWKDPALSAKVPVRPDGKITLPMIGAIDAAGRTTEDLKAEIAEKLKPFVERPIVSVMVSEIHAARFYVLGEVAHPGAFPVRGPITVVQALALAGGPTEFANARKVVVIRSGKDGTQTRYKVDARDVLAGNAPALPLVPGDTVFVP